MPNSVALCFSNCWFLPYNSQWGAICIFCYFGSFAFLWKRGKGWLYDCLKSIYFMICFVIVFAFLFSNSYDLLYRCSWLVSPIDLLWCSLFADVFCLNSCIIFMDEFFQSYLANQNHTLLIFTDACCLTSCIISINAVLCSSYNDFCFYMIFCCILFWFANMFFPRGFCFGAS